MGQAQSSGPADNSSGGLARDRQRCHYEVLGIESQASDEEIKRAYRKKALELHPDRNYGNVDETTQLFAEVQSAYEVLSDSQERAWYDSHRDEILQNNASGNEARYEHNVRITTAEDITRMYMNFSGYFVFDDGASGFFTIFCEFFDKIAKEENLVRVRESMEPVDFPEFGSSKNSYEHIRPFYLVWSGFSTVKSFAWKDQYRFADAPDRRIRRAMEKENKRLREEGKREFNSAVKALVSFIKKKDPRYLPNVQSTEDRLRTLRDMAAVQAAKSRAANMAKVSSQRIQAWAIPDKMDQGAQEEFDEPSSEEREQFQCVVCKKLFNSEKQYQAHERSKKHIKTKRNLLRRIQQENIELGLTQDRNLPQTTVSKSSSSESVEKIGTDHIGCLMVKEERAEDIEKRDAEVQSHSRLVTDEPVLETDYDLQNLIKRAKPHSTQTSSTSEATEDESNQRNEAAEESHHAQGATPKLTNDLAHETADSDMENVGKRKIGKAKLKKLRKAVAQGTPAGIKCTVCEAMFESRTRLFKHLNEFGHAAAPQHANKLKQ